MPNIFGVFRAQKRAERNLVNFRVEKGPFKFVMQCYIWALFGQLLTVQFEETIIMSTKM